MRIEYLFVIITGILSGLLVFGGQVFLNLGLSVFQISFISQLIVIAMLSPFIISNEKLRPKRGMNWLWVLYGLVTSIVILAQYGALVLGVPVAIVVLLLYTQPLWTIVISKLFLKEALTRTKITACLIVLIGMVILVNPFNSFEVGNFWGVILALIGGLTLSLWVIIGSVVSKRKVHPITTKFINATLTVTFFLILYPVLLFFIKDPSIVYFSFNLTPMIWVYLIIFTLFAEVVNHIFYFKGVKKVPTVDAGIILLLEPVTGALLALLFLNQLLTLNIIIGGALILIANYLIIRKPLNYPVEG